MGAHLLTLSNAFCNFSFWHKISKRPKSAYLARAGTNVYETIGIRWVKYVYLVSLSHGGLSIFGADFTEAHAAPHHQEEDEHSGQNVHPPIVVKIGQLRVVFLRR